MKNLLFLLLFFSFFALGNNNFSPKGIKAIWDSSDTVGIQDGAGDWNSSSARFTYETGASNSPFCQGCNVSFGGGGAAGTITTTGIQRINSFTSEAATGSYTISGGTLSCVNNSSCNYNINHDINIGSVIDGTMGIVKNGTETLTLSGANTNTGTMDITEGHLIVAGDMVGTAFPVIDTAIGTSFTISIADPAWINTAHTINGGGDVIIDADVTIAKLDLRNDSNSTFEVTSGNQATLTSNDDPMENFGGRCLFEGTFLTGITNVSCLGISGGGTIWHTSGSATINIGGTTPASFSGNLDLINTNIFNVTDASMDQTFSGVISNTGTITKGGLGQLIFSDNNTNTGATTISAGTLSLGDGTAMGNIIPTANSVTNNATLIFNTPSTIEHSGVVSGTGTLTKQGTGILALTGTNTYTGVTTISSGTLSLGDGTATGNIIPATNLITNDATLIYSTPSALVTHSGVISGAGPLIKKGTGALSLSGTNTYTGGTTISSGTLRTTQNNAVIGTITLGDADTGINNVKWEFNGDGTPSNNIVVENLGTGTATIGTYSAGSSTISSGSLTLNRDTILHDQTGNAVQFNGIISGAPGTIFITGTRVLFSNAGNIFEGIVDVANGSVLQTNVDGLPDTTDLVLNGNAIYQIFGGSEMSFDSLTGDAGSRIKIAAGSDPQILSIGNDNGGATFNGVIAENISVIKEGTGTQFFAGVDTYTGTTTVNDGVLQLQNTGAYNGGITVNAAGTLNLNDTTGMAGAIVNDGITNFSMSVKGFGSRDDIGGESFSGTGTVNINNAANTPGTLDGGWVKFGDGINSPLAFFTNSGPVNINSGVFTRDHTKADTIDTTADFTVAAGAGFGAGRGGNSNIGGLFGAGDVGTFWGNSPGSITIGNGDKDGDFDGIIRGDDSSVVDGNINAGTMSVIKMGTGTQRLNGVNTYVGNTSIDGGTLQIDGAGSLGSGSYAGAISNSGIFRYSSSADQTLSGTISGTGNLIKDTNNSILTLTGTPSFTGATTVSDGGTISWAPAAVAVNSSVTININGASTFQTNPGTQAQMNATNYNFDAVGGGTVDFSGENSYSVVSTSFNTNGGASNTIQSTSGNGYNLHSGAIVTTFNTSGTDVLNVSAKLWNVGNIIKSGTGTAILSAVNTNTGSASVNGGFLGGTGSVASCAVTVGGSGTIFGGTGTGNAEAFTVGSLTFSSSSSALNVNTDGVTTSKIISNGNCANNGQQINVTGTLPAGDKVIIQCSSISGTDPALGTVTPAQTLNLFRSLNNYVIGTARTLDTVNNIVPSGAYSLVKLFASHEGPAIQVRRSSDSNTLDINFLANGDLDVTALEDFVGAATGTVAIWYDQSGHGRNAVQEEPLNQPVIINAGVLNTSSRAGIPSISFDGSQWLDTGTSLQDMTTEGRDGTVFIVLEPTLLSQFNFGIVDNGRWAAHLIHSDGNSYFDAGDFTGGRVQWTDDGAGVWRRYSLVRDASNAWIRRDGIHREVATGLSAQSASTSNFFIGAGNGSTARMVGEMTEIIIYDFGVIGTNQSLIETHQADYWGVL